MPADRSRYRNVYFYDAVNPGVILGGLRQNGSVTEATLLGMLEGILLVVEAPICVRERVSGRTVTATNDLLPLGQYDIYCDSPIELTDELPVMRLITWNETGREDDFRDGIRARDGGCVISGVVNVAADADDWTTFQAAHIFPLERENLWIENGYNRWITDMDDYVGLSKINSCQNGLLMRSHLHQWWDQYLLSVNPDDNYKIVVFGHDLDRMDGRILDPSCRDPEDPRCVPDQLLRWHFRQSVLANMKGAGEPIFEHDFPSGTDMIAEISKGPYAKERLEMEFAARLRRVAQY